MKQEYSFDTYQEFIDKFNEIKESGVPREDITLIAPHPVHGFDEKADVKTSKLRWFTLLGALSGTITGFGLTIYTVLSWPLNTAGKPLISIPPFMIIAFELTILFGGIVSFLGFLLLARMPSLKNILKETDYGNKFVIIVDTKEKS
jgi:hypothetical protein